MAQTNLGCFLQRLRNGEAARSFLSVSDQQLVEWLRAGRDDEVFEAAVLRHGQMVYRVCWRVLRNDHDAEDVFQATFLLLAQKIHGLRKQASLASWLHGVAHRISLKAKARSAARQRHEQKSVRPQPALADEAAWKECSRILDAQLAQLPEKWRLPLLLCYLQGRTQDEAALQLGWSKRTVRRRLEEARAALGKRLAQSGVVWSAVLLTDAVAPAALPAKLVSSTVQAAACLAAGNAVPMGIVSAKVTGLMSGMEGSMLLSKSKLSIAVFLAVCVVVPAAGWMMSSGSPVPLDPPRPLATNGVAQTDKPKKAATSNAKLPSDTVTPTQLFRQMETAIVKATTAEVTFEGNLAGVTRGRLKGSLLIATGNKYRLSIEGDLVLGPAGKQPVKVLMVSDGKKSTTASLGPNTPLQVMDTPKNLDAETRLFLARAGVLGPMFLLAENVQPGQKPREFKAEEQLRVSDLSFGKVETIGGREARVLHHNLHNRLYKKPHAVTVWLDVKTHLPLKRIVSMKQDELAMTVTETYSKLSLNEPIEEKRFELPSNKLTSKPIVPRVSLEENRATVEGQLDVASELVLRIGEEKDKLSWSHGAKKPGAFKGLVEISDKIKLNDGSFGRGIVFTVDEARSNIAITKDGAVPYGQVSFRKDSDIVWKDGAATFGDIKKEDGELVPVSILIKRQKE